MAAGQTSAGGGGAELKSAVLDYNSFNAGTQPGTGYSFLMVTLPSYCNKLVAFSASGYDNVFMVYPGFEFRQSKPTLDGAAFIYDGSFRELKVNIMDNYITFIGDPDFNSGLDISALSDSYNWNGICYYE